MLFQFDVQIAEETVDKRLGQRAYVRFDHEWEPLAYRWYRTARRLFLKSFNV
jgi:putative peptide zinc metalloprotease protein